MTVIQKRKLLVRIAEIEGDIEELKRVRMELASSGYSSASLSSTGGAKSYTRMDISKVTEAISQLQSELVQCRSLLAGGIGLGAKQIYHYYY